MLEVLPPVLEVIVWYVVNVVGLDDVTKEDIDVATCVRDIEVTAWGDGGVGLGPKFGRIGLSCHRIVACLFINYKPVIDAWRSV